MPKRYGKNCLKNSNPKNILNIFTCKREIFYDLFPAGFDYEVIHTRFLSKYMTLAILYKRLDL